MDGYMSNNKLTPRSVDNDVCHAAAVEMGKKFIDCPSAATDKIGSKSRVTQAEAEAASYLTNRHIVEFLNFLMAHLVAEQPSDPINYLFDLLDKCLLFRSGLVEPPLLFAPRHIESLYNSLDPGGVGHITLSQYVVGMKTFGIDCFNPNPMTCKCNPDRVDKDTFMREAKSCLVKMLKEMIAKPACDCC